MRGAGCTWNDIHDQEFDLKVARTKLRPLPSGQVTKKQALIWMLAQMILSFFILLTFNSFAIIVGILSLIPVAIYPFAKRFTWWPQFFLGICFNWGILVSFAAHNNNLEKSALILYAAGIFWTLFYDTIYAFQDVDDDALIGLKSTALLFKNNAKYWLAGFASISFILIEISFSQSLRVHIISNTIIVVGAFIFYLHLLWQLWKFNSNDSNECLRLFKSNKTAGNIIVIFTTLAITASYV